MKTTDGIAVNTSKKTVTLSANNLNGKNVTISGDYKLKLGSDVKTSAVKSNGAFTTFASGTATYTTAFFSDYYSLKNNKITHTAASNGKAITITGLNSKSKLSAIKSGISVTEQQDGSFKITFNKANVLSSKAPTVTADEGISYTLSVAKALKPAALAPDWKVSGTNASLKSDTSAGYSVVDNQIVYSAKKTGSAQLVLGGLAKNASLSAPDNKVVTLDTSVLGTNASLKSNAGKYSVKLTGNMSGKSFTGTSKVDTLNIAANNAAIDGGAGNDSFTVSGSKVTLTGGKGNDSISLQKAATIIYGAGDGADTVNFVKGMQISLSGSTEIKTLDKSGSDIVLGFGKNSSVKVTGVKDGDEFKVIGSDGSLIVDASKFDLASKLTFNSANTSVKVAKDFTGSLSPSDDIYLGGTKLASVATINAGAVTGKVTISGNAKANKIFGGTNNDSLWGAEDNDTLSGGKGNDVLRGRSGNDSLNGGSGNDTLSGYTGNDILLGGSGNDSLNGGAGKDTLNSGAGDDILFGGKGNDSLNGGAGNDNLNGGTGNDTMIGGDGADIFVYSSGKDVITDYEAQDTIQFSGVTLSDVAISKNDILLKIGEQTLTVKNAKDKEITLGDGKIINDGNIFDANKISVTLTSASDKNFDLSKYSGVANIDATAISEKVTLTGSSSANSLVGSSVADKIYGKGGNDILNGGAGNDTLSGYKGNDKLFGEAGNDSLNGGAGKDTLSGGAGNDKLLGGAGNDSLWGGKGNDSLYGGSGNDIFVYKPNEGTDKIFDYASGDMLQILKTDGKAGGAFTKATFSGNELTLAIDGGGKVIFEGVNAGDKVNINSKTYTISGKTLK